MKTHAILAALVLAAPATTLAGHRGPIFFPGACVPPPVVCHPGFAPRGFYAPRPFLSFSYVSSPFVGSRYVAPSPVYRATRYYESADSSIEVDVQRALRRLGYYRGSIDGDIGPRSRLAIRDFQADNGLPATGRIDGSLLRVLGI
ncbi:MAG: peptidoglycan-binding domain-containing protein [Chthoniobacteraceae bacterium]